MANKRFEKQEKIFKEVKKEFWEPTSENPMIDGEIIREETGLYGRDLIILCESGNEFTIPNLTVLKKKLADVKIGDTVRITLLGEKPSKSTPGKTYKDFKVEVAE